MNKSLITTLVWGVFLAPFYSLPAYADDTEIYFYAQEGGTDEDEVDLQPNILFVFDTSGSMGSTAPGAGRGDYDPNFDYGGSSDPDYIYIHEISDQTDLVVAIPASQFDCPSIKADLASNDEPYVDDRLAYFSGGRWRNLGDPGSRTVECRTDNNSVSRWRWRRRVVTPHYHEFLTMVTPVIETRSKMAVMQDVVIDMLVDMSGYNVGIMAFNDSEGDYLNPDGSAGSGYGNTGGFVIKAVQPIDANKAALITAVNTLERFTYTPLAETMWEARQYFTGGAVKYGKKWNDSDTTHQVSDPASTDASGDNYLSPVVEACQQNHIVYLTDGVPRRENGDVQALTRALDDNYTATNCTYVDGGTQANQTCLDELSDWLYTNDVAEDNVPGTQIVRTHTIGFDIDLDLLATTASRGGGGNYNASSAGSLEDAFSRILTAIKNQKDTFVAPAVTVNAYNSLQNRDALYYALFQPNYSPRWDGNLKRYRVDVNGDILDVNGDIATVADTGFFSETAQSWWSPRIDGSDVAQGGVSSVLPASRTLYTYTADGSPAVKDLSAAVNSYHADNALVTHALVGVDDADDTGRAAVLDWVQTPAGYFPDLLHNRPTVVTYGGDASAARTDRSAARAAQATYEEALVAVDEAADALAAGITAADDTATAATAARDDAITARDAANAAPADTALEDAAIAAEATADTAEADAVAANTLVTVTPPGPLYVAEDEAQSELTATAAAVDAAVAAAVASDTAAEAALDETVYAATNMGFLHAFNTRTGVEEFAYIPLELIPNTKVYYDNDSSTSDKTYGLDGSVTVWREESDDADENIEVADGDHIYLYVGMRRGGSSYYALDVTDRSAPKFMWQIDSGGDFPDLAQTWSKPKLAKVNWGCSGGTCTEKVVLFFAGGYNTAHDDASFDNLVSDDTGNAIYMVDAVTGDLLWSASRDVDGLAGMDNSMPADVTVADIDSDGLVDWLFAADIMGNVWRFDFSKTTTNKDDFATGGKIADLSDTSAEGSFRRFFNTPDVAYFERGRGSNSLLTISFASGYRAHPLDEEVTDRFYMLYDHSPFYAPRNGDGDVEYTAVDNDDLFDGSSNSAVNATNGWYKNLTGNGEKGLSSSLIFAGKVVFTTYMPENDPSVCGNVGSGRLYILDALTGLSYLKDGDDSILYVSLAHGGIPPEPALIFVDATPDDPTTNKTKEILCIGTECFGDKFDNDDPLTKVFWREN